MAKTSDQESCISFGKGYLKESPECKSCSKSAKARANKCKKLTKKLIEESCSTDEEIDKWMKGKKK